MKHFEMYIPTDAEDDALDAMRYIDDLHIIRTETVQVDPIMVSPAVVIYFTSGANLGHDFIQCVLWNGIAENTAEYCRKGDLVGIKGRIQKLEEDEEMTLIAEKVTFLSAKENE